MGIELWKAFAKKKKRALIPLDVIREGCIRFCKASGGDQQMHFKMLFLISDGHNCISSLWTNTFIPGGKSMVGAFKRPLKDNWGCGSMINSPALKKWIIKKIRVIEILE